MDAVTVCNNLRDGQKIVVNGTDVTITTFTNELGLDESWHLFHVIADGALNFNINGVFHHHIGKVAAAQFITSHGYTVI